MAYKQIFGRDNLKNENISALTNGGDTPVTDPVSTDPKKKKKPKGTSTTATTSVKGTDPNMPGSRRKGTIFTDTVTTVYDGTTGTKKPAKPTGPTQPFNNPAVPGQTYQEFMDAPFGSLGKPAKTPDTPGRTSVTSSTRFVPDPLAMPVTLDSYGPNHKFDMPKGEPIEGAKPFSDLVTMKISKGPGVLGTERRMASILNSAGGLTEHTMDETVVTRDEKSRIQMGVNLANQDLRDRYNPENIKKEWAGNPKGMANALANAKERIAANLVTIDGSRDVYDAEASTIKGGTSRVIAKNRPAKNAAEKEKRSKLKAQKVADAAAKAAALKAKRDKERAAKVAAIEKKKKERAALVAKNRKRN